MPDANSGSISISARAGGMVVDGQITREASGVLGQKVVLESAVPATTSLANTAFTACTLTFLNGSHGLQNGDVADVYFGASGLRKNVVLASFNSALTSCQISGGSGDVLPANASAVTIMVPVSINVDFLGDELKMIACKVGSARGRVAFIDDSSGGAEQSPIVVGAGEPWFWADDMGTENPLDSVVVTRVIVSHASATQTPQFVLNGIYAST